MLENSCVGIGWPKLGNLKESQCQSKECFEARFVKSGYFADDQTMITMKARETSNFLGAVGMGNIILAQEGEMIQAIGLINDWYTFDNSRPLAHQCSVVWKVIAPNLVNPEAIGWTVKKLRNKELKAQVMHLLGEERWNLTNKPLQKE